MDFRTTRREICLSLVIIKKKNQNKKTNQYKKTLLSATPPVVSGPELK